MSTGSSSEFIGAAVTLYERLMASSASLLQDFDRLSPEEFERALGSRQQIIAELDTVTRELGARLADAGAELDVFKHFQEETTRKVLEFDALVISLARERLDVLREDLASLARGKTALHGYEGKEKGLRTRLDSVA